MMNVMKLIKKNKYVILAIIVIYVVMSMSSVKKVKGGSAAPTGKWTVYGTDWCGYTTKQLKYMDDNSIEYEYIECSNGACDAVGIKAFPTLRDPSGTLREPGFLEI